MSRKRTKRRKEPKTLLDIVIPVMGRFDLLTQCIDAIPDAVKDIPYKIYIWDNDSPDKEEADEFYKNKIDKALVIRNPRNIGFSRACNKAVSRGRSPLIFLLNSDVILDPESVDLLVRAMDDPKVGVVGMKLVFPSEPAGLNPNIRPADKLQHIGLSANIRGEIVHSFVGWNPDHERVNAQSEVFAVTGAAFMTRRNFWIKVKGFDEIYGMGTFEDVDLCMKARDLGYNILVEPKARGIHYTGATAEGHGIMYPLGYNHMQFMTKWGNKIEWFDWRIL